jgi:putative SOS response-associated peptidase YedK
MMRWGLTMPDPRMTGINAKMENLGRVYGDAIQRRRCLVVTDGFFEWKTVGAKKFPYLIHRDDQQPMVFGGIFDDDGVAIVTKPADGVVKELHERMPVILERAMFATWIDPAVRDVKDVMRAAHGRGLSMFPVSTQVNSVRNDRPELIVRQAEPVVHGPRQMGLFS